MKTMKSMLFVLLLFVSGVASTATYIELFEYRSTADYQSLVNRVVVAVVVKAEAIASEATPTAEEIAWAVDALTHPRRKADAIINYVIAANKGLSIATITAATDASIQTNVNTAVDKLFGV